MAASKKNKTKFYCQECGCESIKWLGKCPDCGKWNTFVEEAEIPATNSVFPPSSEKPTSILDIKVTADSRFSTNMEELDRVLGGGVVAGSVILIGGDPGIGKSTLLLQACNNLSKEKTVLYVSGEESGKQIKLRAQRMGVDSKNLYVLSQTNLDLIMDDIKKANPSVVAIDSIQTVFRPSLGSSPGSVGQVRECTAQLMYMAKTTGIVVFIVGHVTKEGNLAGPRILEHIVDTVLYFEGDEHRLYRILRTTKNRFGSTNEIGVFEMRENGLMQVENPSQVFLNERNSSSQGSVVVAAQEGDRPVLVEIQALVTSTNFGVPQRRTKGVDYNRVSLLIAVLEKRVGMQISGCDVFVNVAGGINIDEPAADLGIILAIASSFKNKAIDDGMAVMGEIGLSGEIRAINYIERRVKECQKLGFKKCIVPKSNLRDLSVKGMEIIGISMIQEAIDNCFK